MHADSLLTTQTSPTLHSSDERGLDSHPYHVGTFGVHLTLTRRSSSWEHEKWAHQMIDSRAARPRGGEYSF